MSIPEFSIESKNALPHEKNCLIYDEQRESVDTLIRFLCCGYLEAVLNLFRQIETYVAASWSP